MDQVQEWLSAGGNGREKHEMEDKGEGETEADDEIVKGLVDRLARDKGAAGEEASGEARPYGEDTLDLPGLDVPELEE